MGVKNLIQNQSVKRKLFVSYLLIFNLPLLFMGIISFSWLGNMVRSQVVSSYQNHLTNVKDTVDKRFRELNNYAVELSQTRWVNKILYMRGPTIEPERVDPITLQDYNQEFVMYNASNDFIDYIGLYFHNKDLVLSSRGLDNFQWFIEEAFNINNMTVDEWQGMISKYNSAYLLNPARLKSYGVPSNGLLYLQSFPMSNSKVLATLIAFIDAKTIEEKLDDIPIKEFGSIYVLDKESNLITGKNMDDKLLKKIISQEFSDKINNYPEKAYYSIGKYSAFYSQSSYNGWKYIAVLPMKVVIKEVRHIQFVIIILVLISSLIGAWLSYELASRNYKPLSNIMNLLYSRTSNDCMTSSETKDEFLKLENAIYSIIEQEDRLTEKIEQDKPILRNGYLLKLLNGNIDTSGKFIKLLNLIGIVFPYENYNCCVISKSHVESVAVELSDVIMELCNKSDIIAYSVETVQNKVIILNYRDEEQLKLFLSKLTGTLKCMLDIDFTIGFGTYRPSMEQLWESYKEALTAAQYRLIKSKRKVILYRDIEELKENYCYYYPPDKETQISNYLRSGELNGALKLFREIADKNINEQEASMNAIQYFFFNAQLTVIKLMDECGISSQIKLNPNEIFMYENMEELRNYIENIYTRICKIVNEGKESHNVELKDKILEYIDENYMNVSLSLTTVADSFGISSSYLSRFFKEQFGYNYLDYVNRKRIEQAKYLLINENMDINGISRTVGYDSDVTFRRTFKKYVGTSPSEFKNNLL
jgi:two-component system, response regulator YesN